MKTIFIIPAQPDSFVVRVNVDVPGIIQPQDRIIAWQIDVYGDEDDEATSVTPITALGPENVDLMSEPPGGILQGNTYSIVDSLVSFGSDTEFINFVKANVGK